MMPANGLTRCPVCSGVVAEDDLQRHLRSHGLPLIWGWLWKHDRRAAALAAVMTVIVALAYVAGVAAIAQAIYR